MNNITLDKTYNKTFKILKGEEKVPDDIVLTKTRNGETAFHFFNRIKELPVEDLGLAVLAKEAFLSQAQIKTRKEDGKEKVSFETLSNGTSMANALKDFEPNVLNWYEKDGEIVKAYTYNGVVLKPNVVDLEQCKQIKTDENDLDEQDSQYDARQATIVEAYASARQEYMDFCNKEVWTPTCILQAYLQKDGREFDKNFTELVKKSDELVNSNDQQIEQTPQDMPIEDEFCQ